MSRKSKPNKRPKKVVRRSGFEDRVELILKANEVYYQYEPIKLEYRLPSPIHKYKPDFVYDGIYLEVKGYLPYTDQIKMIAVKEAHPHLDIRFLFQKPHQLLPRRKITHAQWAIQHGFPWTDIVGFQANMWNFPNG